MTRAVEVGLAVVLWVAVAWAVFVVVLEVRAAWRRRGSGVEPIRHDGLEWCGTCGAALGTDKKRGNSMYAQYVSYRDFEQILLSLGASGSDVQRLWPGEVSVT